MNSNPVRARALHTPQQSLACSRPPQEPRLSWTTRAVDSPSSTGSRRGQSPPSTSSRATSNRSPPPSFEIYAEKVRNDAVCVRARMGSLPARLRAQTHACFAHHALTVCCTPNSRLAGRHLRRSLNPGDPRIPSNAEFGALSRGCLRFVRFYRHLDRGDVFDVSVRVCAGMRGSGSIRACSILILCTLSPLVFWMCCITPWCLP